MASAPIVKVRVASVSKSVPSNVSGTVTCVSLMRATLNRLNVTPRPATWTARLMSALDCAYTPEFSVSVTTLSSRVTSVNGCGVDAVTVGFSSTTGMTGNCAMSAAPLYPATASGSTVKVSAASVSKSVPSNISSTTTCVSLTRSTSKRFTVTPAIPDTVTLFPTVYRAS